MLPILCFTHLHKSNGSVQIGFVGGIWFPVKCKFLNYLRAFGLIFGVRFYEFFYDKISVLKIRTRIHLPIKEGEI